MSKIQGYKLTYSALQLILNERFEKLEDDVENVGLFHDVDCFKTYGHSMLETNTSIRN
jgi:hypothetical protein